MCEPSHFLAWPLCWPDQPFARWRPGHRSSGSTSRASTSNTQRLGSSPPSLSNGVDPKYLFTVSTNPVRRTSKDLGPCLPGIAAQLPPNAVLAYLREDFSGRSRSLPRMQPRPRTFRLPRRTDNALCGFDRGVWVPFRSGGRALYLALYVGQRASASRAEMLARVVNEMRIDPR